VIHEVLIVAAAKRRIREQAEYIATVQLAPEAASKWLMRIYDKIDGLAEMPRRYRVADEDAWFDYEVRRIPIGEFVLFYTIVDETRTVWVIHAKHGKQLTEPDAFPTDLASLQGDDDSGG
jgi:toxin ParE1/3/4